MVKNYFHEVQIKIVDLLKVETKWYKQKVRKITSTVHSFNKDLVIIQRNGMLRRYNYRNGTSLKHTHTLELSAVLFIFFFSLN